jgi:uncharacterized protein YkvS
MGGFTELFNTNSRNGFLENIANKAIQDVANDAIREVTGLNGVLGRGGQINTRKLGRQAEAEAKRQARRDRQAERNRQREEKSRSRESQREEEPEQQESGNQDLAGGDNELPSDPTINTDQVEITENNEQVQTQAQEVGDGGIKQVSLEESPEVPRENNEHDFVSYKERFEPYIPEEDRQRLGDALDFEESSNDEWQVYNGHSDGDYDQNTAELQTLLKKLDELDPEIGIDLGEYGPNKDGIDGVFGDMTQNSVIKTQMALYKDLGIDEVPDGVGDQELKDMIEQRIDHLENPPEQDVQAPATTFAAKPITIEV